MNRWRMLFVRSACGGFEMETRTVGSRNGKRSCYGGMTRAKRAGGKLARRAMREELCDEAQDYVSDERSNRDERGRFKRARDIRY